MKSFNPKSNKGDFKNNSKDKNQFDKNKKGNPFKEERVPNVFDRAFQDPDKARKLRERDELIGPREEKVFSKSIDDVENPKYGVAGPFNKKKTDFAREEKTNTRGKFERNNDRKFSKDRKDFRQDKRSYEKRNDDGIEERTFSKDRPYNKDRKSTDRKGFDKGSSKENRGPNGDYKKDFKSSSNRSFDKNEGKNFKSEERGERYKDTKFKDSFKKGEGKFRDNSSSKKGSENKGKVKQFEKFMKPGKDQADGLDNYKFKSRFTAFDDENKVYAAKSVRNTKGKFEGKDNALENALKADFNPDAKMPLNKYLSRSGVCSRRDAVEIVKSGNVTVNGSVINEPGYKVQEGDIVKLNNKRVNLNKEYVYVLLNKPKGYITTLDDPKGRRIISELYEGEIKERIFPVGRLDRNTTGLILLTNDGDLSNQLAHPKYVIKKIYQVKLDKPVSQLHMNQILNGLELEDGIAEVDQLSYLTAKDEIGIEIHSGKNRIVRRIFEHLGYEVEKLDRVLYAGLTKKNLPKGKWRFLTRQEVINLKHLGKKKSDA